MGPLAGIRVLEFEAIGPGPFCGMMLADMGADVLLVDRPQDPKLGLGGERWSDVMLRGRRSVTLDLKSTHGTAAALALAARADVIIEGFRPGVMERLGLGPDVVLARHPRVVYGRMTGWGQAGPLAARAGHDLDYIALSGALHAIGRAGAAPTPPLNLVGDFGGGGMLLAFGIVSALVEARALRPRPGRRRGDRRRRFAADDDAVGLAGGRAMDGRPRRQRARFGRAVVRRLRNAGPASRRDRRDRAQVLRRAARAPRPRERAPAGAGRSRRMAGAACALRQHFLHPHARRMVRGVRRRRRMLRAGADVRRGRSAPSRRRTARATVTVANVAQPAPAPHFSRTSGAVRGPPPERGAGGREALADWGFPAADVERLASQGLGFQ